MISNIVSGLIPFALLLVTTRYLSPSDFGVAALFAAIAATLTAVFSLGLNGVVSRYYFEFTSNEFPRLLGSCFSLISLGGLFFIPITYVFGYIYFPFIHFPVEWIWPVIVFAMSQVIINIGLALFQVKNQTFYYSLIQISQSTIMAVGSIFLVVIFPFGWQGYVFSQVFSSLILSILVLCYLIKARAVEYCFDKQYWRESLHYGLPIAIHAIGGILIAISVRFILAKMTNLDAIGLYVFASQMVAIFIFVIDAFNKAYAPWLFSILSGEKTDLYPRLIRYTYLHFILILIVAIFFALFAGWFVRIIFVIQYFDAIKFILPLSLAAAFMGMYFMVTLYLQFAKRTKQLAAISVISGMVQIFLSIKFIEFWGAIGAAYSLVATQLFLFLATWVVASYLFPMPWKSSFMRILDAYKNLLALTKRF